MTRMFTIAEIVIPKKSLPENGKVPSFTETDLLRKDEDRDKSRLVRFLWQESLVPADECLSQWGGSHGDLEAILHDHCYWKKEPCTPTPPSPLPLDNLFDQCELQYLFDHCNLDVDFLAQAQPSHNNFLEELISECDVPADDMLLYVEVEGAAGQRSLVPTKASCCLAQSPRQSASLFTCAGSTETRLSTCLFSAAAGTTHTAFMTTTSVFPASVDCHALAEIAPTSDCLSTTSSLEQLLTCSSPSSSSAWNRLTWSAQCEETFSTGTSDRKAVSEATPQTPCTSAGDVSSSGDVSLTPSRHVDDGDRQTVTDTWLTVDRASVGPCGCVSVSSAFPSFFRSSSMSSLPLYSSPPPSPTMPVLSSDSAPTTATSLNRKRKSATECVTPYKRLRATPAPTSLDTPLPSPVDSPVACTSPQQPDVESADDTEQDSVTPQLTPSLATSQDTVSSKRGRDDVMLLGLMPEDTMAFKALSPLSGSPLRCG